MSKECYLVISDLHGSDEGIDLVKKAIEMYKPIGVLSAGDQCPDPFEPLYSTLIAVRGNCDSFYLYDSIPFPPLFREISIFGKRCIMTHGDRYCYDDFDMNSGDVFISGHTHVPMLKKKNGIYLFNPGSPSRPRSSFCATAGLFFTDSLEVVSLLDFSVISALAFSDRNKD